MIRPPSWRAALGCIGLLALLPGSGAQGLSTEAQSGPVDVQIELTPEAPVIGDALVLKIRVTADSGVEVLMPEFGEALDRFRIVDFVPREEIDEAGRTIYSQRYTLQAPASGPHLLPALLIEFVDRRPGQKPAPDGQDAYEILTQGLPFAVASVMPDRTASQLMPPMGPLQGPQGSGVHWGWWGVGLGVLAAALVFMAVRATRRGQRLSAWETACAELDALLSGPRPGPEDIGPFFVALSDIVRRYLELRFSLRSPELTTERFLDLMADSPDLSRRHQQLLRDFLNQCDLVKFAGHIPSAKAIDEAAQTARRFLDETREGDESTHPDPTAPSEALRT
ncbi:MAG: hypothetical protein VX252_11700 [Myxococcota bacterium]|nr:hypothetical protein [Myxococcota bacterium]